MVSKKKIYMSMFAKFDEIPAMTLQDIKETKHYRRMHRHTDGQRENSIPTTNKVCGGYKESIICVRMGQKKSLSDHRLSSLMMPNSDPQEGFFYPTLTLRIVPRRVRIIRMKISTSYSKICVKQPLKNRQNKDLNDK